MFRDDNIGSTTKIQYVESLITHGITGKAAYQSEATTLLKKSVCYTPLEVFQLPCKSSSLQGSSNYIM